MTYGVKVSTEGQAEIVECDSSLGSMRRIIRGCIESIPMPTRGGALAYFCDKAGRLERKNCRKTTLCRILRDGLLSAQYWLWQSPATVKSPQ